MRAAFPSSVDLHTLAQIPELVLVVQKHKENIALKIPVCLISY